MLDEDELDDEILLELEELDELELEELELDEEARLSPIARYRIFLAPPSVVE